MLEKGFVMEIEFIFGIIIVTIIVIIVYLLHIKAKKDAAIRQKNIDLITTVTPLSKGTHSEHLLILSLLKYGINSGAIFHDLYVYKPDGETTQIDVVVATSVGIIVFEVKDYSGWIFGKGNQQKWTQVFSYGRERYYFYNPILQNKSHILQLQRILKENVPFYSVIVFYGDCELQDINFIPQNTYVTKYYRIIDVIENILHNNPPANYKNKHNIVKILKKAVANGNNNQIEKKHIEKIRDMLGDDRIFR